MKVKSANSTLAKNHDDHPLSPAGRLRLVQLHHFPGHDLRLHLLCTKPDAKTITIRLDHGSAEAALAAPRGPANYLAEIIKRALVKLGIETEVAFNLEFNHTGSTENHPLHIHGALCIPDDRVVAVSEALRTALALDYRQRYKNVAVHIEKPRSARWWATYCIKEYSITASRLEAERGRKSRPDYAAQALTKQQRESVQNEVVESPDISLSIINLPLTNLPLTL